MIPFNKPFVNSTQESYIQETIRSGRISGDGIFTKKVQDFLESEFFTEKALLTTSCTMALEMATLLINLQEGDEVILPSYTFVSTANPILMRGAKPVFAEIREDTLNIDVEDIYKKITKKTKAIFPVHYAGVSCDMDTIMSIAKEYGLRVVEDAAQGVNAKYKGRYLGTIGDIGCYSFHETKNYSCGEGGAILINGNKELINRAEIIREKGTNRSMFIRGEVDKYTWMDIGSSFLPSDILSAVLMSQLEVLNEIQEKRRRIYHFYYHQLKTLADKGYLTLPVIPENCESNYHIFYVILNSEEDRNHLMDYLKQNNVAATFHYIPLHLSPMGKKLGYKLGDFPKTEKLSSSLLRLPIYPDLQQNQVEYIVHTIHKFYQRYY